MTDPREPNRTGRARLRIGLTLALAAAVGVGFGWFLAVRTGVAPPSEASARTAAPASSLRTPAPAGATGPMIPGSTAAPGIPAIPGAPARPTGPTRDATLVRVTDGDTIRVMVDGAEERVRYIGIDTPEVRPNAPATREPYADAATQANSRLLAAGRIVLERDVSERDRYGRLLAHVWTEQDGRWTLVSLALVRDGLARASVYRPDVKYREVLAAAEVEARAGGRGQWADPAP